jgi:hypothetical protein
MMVKFFRKMLDAVRQKHSLVDQPECSSDFKERNLAEFTMFTPINTTFTGTCLRKHICERSICVPLQTRVLQA